MIRYEDLVVGMYVKLGQGKQAWRVATIDHPKLRGPVGRWVEIELCGLALTDRYNHRYVGEYDINEGILSPHEDGQV